MVEDIAMLDNCNAKNGFLTYIHETWKVGNCSPWDKMHFLEKKKIQASHKDKEEEWWQGSLGKKMV